MKKLPVIVLFGTALLFGCGRKESPPVKPSAPAEKPTVRFPEPTEAESARLKQLDGALRGSLKGLDLKWAADMGAVVVPELARLAGDATLSVEARDLVFLVLGNAMKNTDLREHPDARNEVVVPVLLKGLADADLRVRRSAAFAARFVDDARLVPALRPLLEDKDIVQEQAVLALGTNGREMEVLPIAKLFFEVDNGVFRYSCLYALSMMSLVHNVNVAEVLRSNAAYFPTEKQQNLESVVGRFTEFKTIQSLVQKLASDDVTQRREANGTLQKLMLKNISFDPAGDAPARAKAIEDWKSYLLKDFWRAPSPHPPAEETSKPAQQ
jgi:hypothetical protein